MEISDVAIWPVASGPPAGAARPGEKCLAHSRGMAIGEHLNSLSANPVATMKRLRFPSLLPSTGRGAFPTTLKVGEHCPPKITQTTERRIAAAMLIDCQASHLNIGVQFFWTNIVRFTASRVGIPPAVDSPACASKRQYLSYALFLGMRHHLRGVGAWPYS